MMIWLYLIFGTPYPLLVILPLTMCGRVYVFCHWFGDTLFGAIIGIGCGTFFYQQMETIGMPLFDVIMKF